MSETELHRSIAQMLDLLGWLWCHCPNGGKRHLREAAKLKAMGVKPGVPDILIFESWEYGGRSGHGVAIELKGAKGRTTDAQEAWLGSLHNRGWLIAVCNSTEQVVEMLQYVNPLNKCGVINKEAPCI